tara:strand:- start:87 stop:302 length:216 start_codon:yes stop_codon:yes gene_type:complete
MSNIRNKKRNYICPCCGRDSQSHNLGSPIVNVAKEIRKKDPQADILIVHVPLTNSDKDPEHYAIYKYKKHD